MCCSGRNKESKSCSTEGLGGEKKAASQVVQKDERWGMLEWCCRGGKKEEKGGGGGAGEEKARGWWVDGLGAVSMAHIHTCVGGFRRSRPLSCVWSRSRAGGHVGGGWQTEGEEEEEEETWEGRYCISEVSAMTDKYLNFPKKEVRVAHFTDYRK